MTTAVDDAGHVDWLAVEFVCTGTAMRLSSDPVTLRAAILTIGYHLTADQIAERMGTNTRRVLRVLLEYGGKPCPSCRRVVLLVGDGIVPHHVNSSGWWCRMGGYPADDRHRLAQIKADQRALQKYK